MKRLALFIAIFLIPLISWAQFDLDSVGFKSFRVDIYYGTDTERGFIANRHDSLNADVLFYIEDKIIIADGLKDQLKVFFMKADPEYNSDLILGYGGYGLGCIDHGFFNCFVNIIYVPKTDTYGIRVDYSNMRFLFQCKLTDERPWDNKPIDLVADAQSWPNDPDYTNEEVISFFKNLMSGSEFSKALASGLLLDAVNEF
jgi:hypothetical protein